MTSMYQRKGIGLPRLQHVSIPISDGAQDAARTFYGRVLGLEEKPAPRSLRHMKLVWFKVGDSEMELHCFPDTFPAKPEEGRHFCLEVDNLDEYRQRVTEAGCTPGSTGRARHWRARTAARGWSRCSVPCRRPSRR